MKRSVKSETASVCIRHQKWSCFRRTLAEKCLRTLRAKVSSPPENGFRLVIVLTALRLLSVAAGAVYFYRCINGVLLAILHSTVIGINTILIQYGQWSIELSEYSPKFRPVLKKYRAFRFRIVRKPSRGMIFDRNCTRFIGFVRKKKKKTRNEQ